MHVCPYVWTCVLIYVCTYGWVYVLVYMYIYVYVYVDIYVHFARLDWQAWPPWPKLDPSPPLGPPFGMPPFLSLFNLAFCQHPSPFSKPISTLGVYALGSLLRGLYRERRFINLEIRYDTCVYTVPIAILASRRKTSFLLMLTVQCMNVLVYHKHRIDA